jgi:hypothetical protein
MVLDRRGFVCLRTREFPKLRGRKRYRRNRCSISPETDAPEAHQQNFLDCIRSRQEPNCPVEIAAAAVTGPHMANLAYRQDRKIRHDSTVNG